MKILIVEDEYPMREGLKTILRKEDDLQVVGACSNGKQALAYLKQHPDVDVVLLDLYMPVMDGLQFLSVLDPAFSGRVIVLSSYDDLDNVKEAMKKGADDYFHKPLMSPEKIMQILREKGSRDRSEESDQVEKWIKQLIQHPSKKLLENKFHWITRPKNYWYTLLLSWTNQQEIEEPNVRIKESYFEWKEKHEVQSEFIQWESETFLMILSSPEMSLLKSDQYVRKKCVSLQQHLKEAFGSEISFGISRPHSSPLELRQSYHEAKMALTQEFFNGPRSINMFGNSLFDKPKEEAPPVNRLWESFRILDGKGVQSFLDEYFHWLHHKAESKEKVIALSVELLLELRRQIEKSGFFKIAEDISPDRVISMRYLQEIRCYIEKMFENSIRMIQEINHQRYSPVIRQVLEHLHYHFHKDIKLNDLAEAVRINPSYLSRIFKEQTGQKLSEYITDLRINRAKELLRQNRLRTKEVASHVGYHNERYFSQIFKKSTGYTPSQYRSHWLRQVRDRAGKVNRKA